MSAANGGSVAWYVVSVAQTALQLGSAADGGLTAAEATQRLPIHGSNEIREQAPRSAWRRLFSQFTDFMIVLLIVAAVISGFIGEIEDAAAILAIVVLNAVIGFVQEYRAEKALRALKQLAALKARVIRDHAIATVPAADLVPGDVVLLEAGSVVPADLRIIETAQLRIEEAALTGESNPIDKQTDPLAQGGASTRTSASSSGSCWPGTPARSSRCWWRRCSGCRYRCCRSRSCGST